MVQKEMSSAITNQWKMERHLGGVEIGQYGIVSLLFFHSQLLLWRLEWSFWSTVNKSQHKKNKKIILLPLEEVIFFICDSLDSNIILYLLRFSKKMNFYKWSVKF